ncbi:MAG TPA: HAD family hydrolase [Candidatus Limnocylindria bacterium]|nr:HAD family hydrolase [Candidatus Limnocylindria bacterium]
MLFDVDGTLVDSNDAHARAWVTAFAEAGYEIPFARIRPLIGMGGDRIIPALVAGLSEATEPGKTIAARREQVFFERELPQLAPTRGARALLEAVHAHGARNVVATSAKPEELDAILARADVRALVDVAASSGDAGSSKPAPDIVVAALHAAALEPTAAVFVGDTRYDIEAAHRAEVPCVALRCGGSDPHTLAEAEAVYDDPQKLLEALDHPPFVWSRTSATVR